MPIPEKTDDTIAAEKTENVNKASGTWRVVTLGVGDALAFLIFSVIGRLSHGEPAGLSALPQVIGTAAPFAISWFIVAPFVGAYRREVTTQPRAMALRTAFAWLLAWPVGLTLRGIFVDHGAPPISFALITLAFNMSILLLWRWPYALTNSLRRR